CRAGVEAARPQPSYNSATGHERMNKQAATLTARERRTPCRESGAPAWRCQIPTRRRPGGPRRSGPATGDLVQRTGGRPGRSSRQGGPMRKRILRAVLLLLLGALLPGPAVSWAKAKKSTPEDRAKAVRLTRELEGQRRAAAAVEACWCPTAVYRAELAIPTLDRHPVGARQNDRHPSFPQELPQPEVAGGVLRSGHRHRPGHGVARLVRMLDDE